MLWLNVVALKRAARRADANSITHSVMRLWVTRLAALRSSLI